MFEYEKLCYASESQMLNFISWFFWTVEGRTTVHAETN